MRQGHQGAAAEARHGVVILPVVPVRGLCTMSLCGGELATAFKKINFAAVQQNAVLVVDALSRQRHRRTNIPGLHQTISRLKAFRSQLPTHVGDVSDERLREFTGFGSNPGELTARSYIPRGLGAGAPLVVVLHGCTQSASSYNRGAGWTHAADENGFALLFPEQKRSNNPNLCFNWFSPTDAARGEGEALSIFQMVQDLCIRHDLDRSRIYITGLSAGGAMTTTMLATYPEVFAGGAVIAGLPFGTATNIPEAFERMRGQPRHGDKRLTNLVRTASGHSGKWPVLSIWHGSGDRTVDVSNAAALVEQWRGLHGLSEDPQSTEDVGGFLRRTWVDAEGVEVVEEFTVPNMGHGTPIAVGAANAGEAAGPYMLDVGISSTRRIIAFWGLERSREAAAATAAVRPHEVTQPGNDAVDGRPSQSAKPALSSATTVQSVIEDALRSAGLMR